MASSKGTPSAKKTPKKTVSRVEAAPAKKKSAKKATAKKSAKKSVYLVEISRTLYSSVYVKAESPEAAKRLVEDKEIAFSDDLLADWGDIEYECDGEEYNDETPDLVDEDDEEDASAEAPEE